MGTGAPIGARVRTRITRIERIMSKNGKSSLTPKAKEAAERFSAKAFAKALRLDKFGPQMETKVADMCREAWAAGYFYAKQENELNK